MSLIKTIKFYLLKFMKRRYSESDDETPVVGAAREILDLVERSTFGIFEDKEFRKLVRFAELPQLRQQVALNELESVGICLAMFALDYSDVLIRPEDFRFWRKVRESLPAEREKSFLKTGLEKEQTKAFRKYLNLRLKEYGKLTMDAWDIFEKEESEFRKLPHNAARHSAACVHAMAIGAADHITHGASSKNSELLKFLRDRLFYLNEEIGKFILRL